MIRDINWAATFEITVNGEPVRFWDLMPAEQQNIVNCIRGDHYSGTFIGEEEDEEE